MGHVLAGLLEVVDVGRFFWPTVSQDVDEVLHGALAVVDQVGGPANGEPETDDLVSCSEDVLDEAVLGHPGQVDDQVARLLPVAPAGMICRWQ